ncbi:hypothetical protein ACS47_04205 [Bacillus cereus]|uniref:fibronectin type III domain-containing protein n=1 Tax=Bacillus paranthracis TaxID=2026186 RepID=UPI00077214D7|nr:fibronectin type III domain-containing protein [Bacillus paranthracis]KXI93007.1 hypothetical protein ACS47_04205 [Bacillus cereus]MDG0887587.1 fibronectin type III domain-containing protein [Bacillus paranthracis]
MRFKKCFAVFSIMMIMCLSVLPSFAKAEVVDYLAGKTGLEYSTNQRITELTDGNITTYYGFSSGQHFVYYMPKLLKDATQLKILADDISGIQVDFYNDSSRVLTYYDKEFNFDGKYYVKDVSRAGMKGKEFNQVRIKYSGKRLNVYDFKLLNGIEEKPLSDVQNIVATPGIDKVDFTWENPNDDRFTGVKVFFEGREIKLENPKDTKLTSTNLEPDKTYMYRFVAMYGEREALGVQKSIRTLIDPKKVPPSPVSSLTAEPTDKTVKLKWKSPKDDDLAGFKVLQNGKQVAEIGLEEEFTVKNLQPLTDYTFGVIAVDRDKNDSPPVSLSVKTLEENDEEPPYVPSNVFAKPSNGALIASWDKVSDKDLAGYNLYVDGKKINSNLITSTNFVIKNLENSKKYKVQVQAVDRSGNASELSLAAFGTPDVNMIPVIESNYGVKDVSDGVGTMFSQIWPALAFSVGIVLAFYVIYKLKHTILP